MQAREASTSGRRQWKFPEAAAPQSTPQISGIHVTGFISCSRIFQRVVVLLAPFIPSIWRAAPPSEGLGGAGVGLSLTVAGLGGRGRGPAQAAMISSSKNQLVVPSASSTTTPTPVPSVMR